MFFTTPRLPLPPDSHWNLFSLAPRALCVLRVCLLTLPYCFYTLHTTQHRTAQPTHLTRWSTQHKGPPLWFQAHRIIQSTGLIISIIAFILALSMVPKGSHFTKLHHKLGLAVMILGILQPMNALIRPHPPKGNAPATLARKVRMRVFMGSRACPCYHALQDNTQGRARCQAKPHYMRPLLACKPKTRVPAATPVPFFSLP